MQDALWITAALFFAGLAGAGAIIMASRLRTLFFGGAPFVVSAKATIARAFAVAGLGPEDRIADLGSGDGLVLTEAIKAGAKHATGFEIDPILVWTAGQVVRRKMLDDKISIIHKNFWDADVSSFDIIFLFQIPYAMKRLEEKLRNECKPGCRIVSNSFAFPHWKPERIDGQLFLYRKD
ncbi:MAG TPA: class I SAM-dependent methyltransferase [Verrucomicrobiae bacterium]|nr:class I SAM-dependent methyltransferase [Verrucomicrobiae bacterium]